MSAPAQHDAPTARLPLILLAAGTAVLALAALYQVQFYLRVPVDLVSFAESPYVNDIIKLRLGVPIYTPVPDNNTYPYTPLSQILTWGIASLSGRGTDIPFLRTVQFGYVLLATIVAGFVVMELARLMLSPERRSPAPLWQAAWTAALFLVALDPRFNPYVHTLHNDGLALLISMCGAWLAARHARVPRAWHLGAMALLPAVGFLVKQNQLMWAGLFTIFLFVAGMPWRRVAVFALAAGVLAAASIGIASLLWGEHFRFWIFGALGEKQVSLARSVLHLQWAGAYAAMGLAALLRLVVPSGSRAVAALWALWAVLFAITTYTSGLGFTANHMGPAALLAACWAAVLVMDLWPMTAGDLTRLALSRLLAAGIVLFAILGVGVVRVPRSDVPRDLERYVAAIEEEFQDMDTSRVLLDNGSWIYLRRGILMKDRALPVSLHVGINQPRINRDALRETIARIQARSYGRILARSIDTDRSPYDFGNRGSGVKTAILANYRIVRRIPGVTADPWWPSSLLNEIVVLEPR